MVGLQLAAELICYVVSSLYEPAVNDGVVAFVQEVGNSSDGFPDFCVMLGSV